jgi:hypothetical protein
MGGTMKRHILRAPATDRYLLDVPTKLSDLEDDIETPTVSGLAGWDSLSVSGETPFLTADFTESARAVFAASAGTDLSFVAPEAGLYMVSITAVWLSKTSSGSGVGRIVTPGAYDLSAGVTISGALVPLQVQIAGTFGRDNKLGPLVTDPGDVPLYPSASGLFNLSAGGVFAPFWEAAVLADTLNVRMTLSIVRIA